MASPAAPGKLKQLLSCVSNSSTEAATAAKKLVWSTRSRKTGFLVCSTLVVVGVPLAFAVNANKDLVFGLGKQWGGGNSTPAVTVSGEGSVSQSGSV